MKKFVLPLAAGVGVFGAVTGFAATLNVSSTSLGAGNATVASCQSDAAVSYTTSGSNVANAVVTFSGGTAGACDNLTAKVTLTGASGSLGSGTATVASDVATVSSWGGTVSASAVTGVSVVISG